MFGVSVRVRRRWQQDALPTFRGALARSLAGPFDRAHSLGEKEEDGTPSARAFASVSPRDPLRSVVIECGGFTCTLLCCVAATRVFV